MSEMTIEKAFETAKFALCQMIICGIETRDFSQALDVIRDFEKTDKNDIENAQLRADLAAVEKERDGMRNCQNCGISELTGGTCEHWQHGMCTDREESDNYLEHWQPLKEQP